ncbi:MAG: adenylate/guanylate cyclase domain-containing protein [Pseudomonadota bacterium]
MPVRIQTRRGPNGRIHDIPTEPRSYTQGVTLNERRWFDLGDHPADAARSVEQWLFHDANGEDCLGALCEAFFSRMQNAGLDIDRATLHIGTLHPQLYGYAWIWSVRDMICDELQVEARSRETTAYKRNPLSRVIDHGERFRVNITDAEARGDSSIMQELFDDGFTEYVTEPLSTGGTYHNAVSLATRANGGFGEDTFAHIRKLLQIFALHVERHIVMLISRNIATTYLGEQAGTRVANGTIGRGAGASMDAIIWVSDLRGFTSLSDRLSNEDVTQLLNDYFAILAEAAMSKGGEVLKFIGDGLLVVFELSHFDSPTAAAEAAFCAAQDALRGIEQMNQNADALPGIENWRPLGSGIALHKGRVFFGNVGAPQRLDFTVIGSAVNAASRIEGLCKELGQPLLLSDRVRGLLSDDFTDHGEYGLRGQAAPMRVFSPV